MLIVIEIILEKIWKWTFPVLTYPSTTYQNEKKNISVTALSIWHGMPHIHIYFFAQYLFGLIFVFISEAPLPRVTGTYSALIAFLWLIASRSGNNANLVSRSGHQRAVDSYLQHWVLFYFSKFFLFVFSQSRR